MQNAYKTAMIITDNTLAPSKRLIEILNVYFKQKGFDYNKTKKCYQKEFVDRVENIYPDFVNRYSLVDVGIYFTLTFPQIWEIYKRLTKSKKRTVQDTVGVSILNYPFSTPEYSSVSLFDSQTGKYDDFTINNASEKFIETYELYVAPFFEKINSLKSLDVELNSLPIKRTYLCKHESHFEIGLILTKLLNPSKLDTIYKGYELYYENSMYYNKKEIILELNEKIKLIKEIVVD